MTHPQLAALVATLLVKVAAAQSVPTPYCTAGVSTNGCAPNISANVQPNISNSAGCVITTSNLEGQRVGLSFYGIDNSGFVPAAWSAGSTSFLCVKGPHRRLGVANSAGTSTQCDGAFVVNWDAYQNANPLALGNPWSVGAHVFVQSWYRDPAAPSGTNLSNALELTVHSNPLTPCASAVAGMAAIPAGSFVMGSSAPCSAPYWNCSADPSTPHTVTLSSCYWIGTHEVTQLEYATLMGNNPSQFIDPTRPVERVTWHDARAYCAALTAQQSALGAVPAGYEYRLPTEAEWEYACRAGTTTEFHFGSALFCANARFAYSEHSGTSCGATRTAPVGSFAPNAWGLFDMHGNVAEWCLDSYQSYPAGPVTDPFVTGGQYRIARGGGWAFGSEDCRSAVRFLGAPNTTENYWGFRVVLAPALVP